MSVYTKERAISDYTIELNYFLNEKSCGLNCVLASVTSKALANGREIVPIDEVIKSWQDGLLSLNKLPAKADAGSFSY